MAKEEQEVQNLEFGSFFRFPYGRVLWEVIGVYETGQGVWLELRGSAYYSRNSFKRATGYQVKAVV